MYKHSPDSCRLSVAGRLSVTIGFAILLMDAAYSQNIAPVGGTTVSHHNGVDIVNVVAPNKGGLSYNQYNKYNVGVQGVVLNNSTVSGQSQLAGQLNANSQLNGQAAKVILNEVISNNPSLLLGKQEVFGMAADFVLANPNGITCTGCGFINTPRASLVVGTPELESNHIAGFAVGANGGSNVLRVSGNVSGAMVLDLIAPKIDVNGSISARDSVNLIAGRQHVAYANLAQRDLAENEQSGETARPVLDGSIVGSISAGTIRIHNSDPRANTDVHGSLDAGQRIAVNVAGDLSIAASELAAPEIAVIGNNLTIAGQVEKFDAATGSDTTRSWDGVSRTTSGSSHREQFTATGIRGGNVSLNAIDSVNLNAVQIDAQNISVKGGVVALESTIATNASSDVEKKSKFLWNNSTESDRQTQTLYENRWKVDHDVSVVATKGAVNVAAASINAEGKVSIDGLGGVVLGGDLVKNSSVTTNSYANETDALKTGKLETKESEQVFNAAQIHANQEINIVSRGNVSLSGAKIDAKQVGIVSQGAVEIGANSSQREQSQSEGFIYAGGIGGGEGYNSRSLITAQSGSTIDADNVTIQGGQGVDITGSTLTGRDSVQLTSSVGNINVAQAFNHMEALESNRHGAAFNITDKSSVQQHNVDTTVASTISSGGDIQITGGGNLRLTGSNIDATGALNVHAAGTLQSDIADAQKSDITQDYTFGVSPTLQHNPSTGKSNVNVTAGVGAQGVTHTFGESSGSATGSSLTGSAVTLQGDMAIDLKGTRISASADNVKLSGQNVTVGSGDSKVAASFSDTNVTGVGAYASATVGDIDAQDVIKSIQSGGDFSLGQISGGFRAGGQQVNTRDETHHAVISTIQASGDVLMQAEQQLKNTGTSVNTTGAIDLTARDIVTDAATNTSISTNVTAGGQLALDVTATALQPVIGTLGMDGAVASTTTVKSSAVVSSLNGTRITVSGDSSATDVGTRYVASEDVNINTSRYVGKAAEDSQVTTAQLGKATESVSGATTTFQDLNVKGIGGATYQYQQTGMAQAVLGNIKGNNITIQAGDSLTSAMNINAADRVMLTAGRAATVAQADNRQWKVQGGVSAGGGIGATAIVASGAFVPSSLSAAGGVDYLNVRDSQAVGARISGKNIAVVAGSSSIAQGANFEADNVTMRADKVLFDAGYDHHDATGLSVNGKVSASLLSGGDGLSLAGGALDGNVAVTKESFSQSHGGSIKGSNVGLIGSSRYQDVEIVGADIEADNLVLSNAPGNVSVHAAKSDAYKRNWSIGGSGKTGSNGEGLIGGGVDGHIRVDFEDSTSYQLGKIKAGTANVTAGQDITMQTNVEAGALSWTAGGVVKVLAAQDRAKTFYVDAAVSGMNPGILSPSKTTAVEFVNGLDSNRFGNALALLRPKASGTLVGTEVKKTQISTVRANQLNVTSGAGEVMINAVDINSAGGPGWNGAKVGVTSNMDSVRRVEVSGDVSVLPTEQGSTPTVDDALFQWPVNLKYKASSTDREINALVEVK